MLWDAMMDALVVGCSEVPASVDATFCWYFRDEDRWLTVDSQRGRVAIRPGLTEPADMKFYSSCVSDFIHQHSTEGAGRAIFQGGGFYWRGDINRLKEISPLCKSLFGPRLLQRLVGGGIAVPKFEARRYPARTKAQRDRIFADWTVQGDQTKASRRNQPQPVQAEIPQVAMDVAPVAAPARRPAAAKPVKAPAARVPAPAAAAKSSPPAPAKKAPPAAAAAPQTSRAAKTSPRAAPAARKTPAKGRPATSGKKVSTKAAKVARKT